MLLILQNVITFAKLTEFSGIYNYGDDNINKKTKKKESTREKKT